MEYAFRNTLTRFMLVLGVLALLTGVVWAQGTAELTGLVTDPSGAVVANVSVTLTNTATGEKRTTVTTPAGIYHFVALPVVGTYTLETSPKGFKSTKVAGIVVSVGATSTRDVKLELGSTSEQVTVEAGAETVQTNESDLSQLVDHRTWQDMPLQVRNQNSFINLVAGAVPQAGSGTNRGAEVNGTRSGAGSYLVEGSDNNEQGQAGRGQISPYDEGGASTSISPDAIQEYRVITNSYSAEYGKGGGFITDTVLKGGTNNWHGSAFEYNRIQALTANDWFSNHANPGIQDSLVRNQFGGSIGGPIFKDKTFFYGTAELHRVRQSNPYGPVTTTTSQFLDFVQSGGLAAFQESDPGGFCNLNFEESCPGAFTGGVEGITGNISTLGPIASTLLASPAQHYPAPSSSFDCTTDVLPGGPCHSRDSLSGDALGVGFPLVKYPVPVYTSTTLNDPQAFNEARWTVKLDHNFSDKDQIHGVYLFQDGTYTESFAGGFNTVGPGYIQDGRGENFALTWNHTFSPTVLNTARVAYLRHKLNFPAPAGALGVPAYYTIDGMSADFGQYSGLPQFFTENQFQYMDTMSIVHGKHSFKFGGEYRRTRNGSSFFNDAFSSIFPWSVEGVLTDLQMTSIEEQLYFGGNYFGAAYLATAAVDTTTGNVPDFYRGYRANEYAAFVQDDWRVTNRLTVNLGLRWEYFGPPHNFQANIDSNFYFGQPVTPINTTSENPFFPTNNPFYASVSNGSFQIRNHEIWNKDTNNFGPRVGFAWDVMGNQKFVVRAGAGVMYDRIYNNTFENIRFNPPYFSDNQIGLFINGVGAPIEALSFPFTTRSVFADPAFAPKPNPRHMDQNIVTPYYEQAHFGVQWEFAKGWVFEPEYVATWGKKLSGISDINTFNGRTDGQGSTRINPNIGADNYRSNSYYSNYNALQLSLRKTYSSGLTVSANYTWAKALDVLSDTFNGKGATSPIDDTNIRYNYGPADFDLRHRIVATVGYDLPFMKENRWLGGWGVNTIISWQTGHPFSPYSSSSGYDLNKNGQRTDRLVVTGSQLLSGSAADACTAAAHINGGNNGKCYLNTDNWSQFVCPESENGGLWCNAPIGRNSVFGPHYSNVDFNITKRFKVTESAGLTFQANFFDLFNHPNFLPPQSPGTTADIRNNNFGQLTATTGDTGGHRVIQLALRFDF